MRPTPIKAFFAILVALLAVYGTWLLVFWPGLLSHDSFAVIHEAQDPAQQFSSGKTGLWVWFVKAGLALTHRVETLTAFQLALTAVVFARILAWCWTNGLRKTAVACGVFIALAPHMVAFSGTLYPDAPFAVAGVAVLFELWRCLRERRVGPVSLGMLALTLPLALFARTNGLVLLVPLAYAAWVLPGRDRLKLVLVTLAWCAAAWAAQAHRPGQTQGAAFPLVLFETVNFLQSHVPEKVRGDAPPRVSAATTDMLARYASMPQMLAAYDRDYWDALALKPDGPQLGRMTPDDRQLLTREFVRYNLWHNLPAFLSSRVNVFLVAALAQGNFPEPVHSKYVLNVVRSDSVYRPFELPRLTHVVTRLERASWKARALLWTPLVGVFLLLATAHRAWRGRHVAERVVLTPMLLQLAGIFLMSSAGEYRYLLPFFVLPLVLLPMRAAMQTRGPSS